MAKYHNPVNHLRRVVLLCLVKVFSGHFYGFLVSPICDHGNSMELLQTL